ncbi:MAG: BrnT family toxin [Terriglobales bacterium]|jgi:hypothetical protein
MSALNERSDYRFEWDKTKKQQNIEKHGLDFADAEKMFHDILFARPDERQDYGERRWIGIGLIRDRVAVVAFTERGPNVIRVISLRKANHREQKQYEEAVKNELEAR